jgi:two-component system CheB/CheR fusion protein
MKFSKQQSSPDTEQTVKYYVAVGASAGGLEAIETLFTNLPPDTGMAFIVVQHLSPDYKSLMVELLSKRTGMKVLRAEEDMPVLPNHVYLIPPKKLLKIFHGKLLLSEQELSRGVNLPIDIFFKSLAEDQGDKAIAVVLSGTGSDGSRGLRSIKESGGMVMVQNEESAKFNGMPRSAISTGLVDFVLSPESMPSQLLAFSKHCAVKLTDHTDILTPDKEALTRIFALLREKSKVDFTYYKPSTIHRRIERRMSLHQFDSLGEYLKYLLNYPAEVQLLYKELLIGVTNFFRDPEAFALLSEKVLLPLLKEAGQELRCWVAGCSTGEEAYSIAISLRQLMEEHSLYKDVKIFATDIDRDAIQFAANGVYPDTIAADLPPNTLMRYFHRKEECYQISRQIREMVVFAQHNIVRDPPFTNISLISCRNLLIYLQPVLQHKVFEYFNFSLKPFAYLFLGSSESLGDMMDYFEVIDQKNKLFKSKGRSKHPLESPVLLATDTRARAAKARYSGMRNHLALADEERVLELFLDAVSEDYLPFSMIVNEHLEVIQLIGKSEKYMRIPSGKMVNDVSKMVMKELAIPITSGIQKVIRNSMELRFSNIRVHTDKGVVLVDLRIKQLKVKRSADALFAVIISEQKKVDVPEGMGLTQTFDLSREAEDHLKEMEQELQFTRENLQATIEELETSNEELQATNEELLASNEELQSTNEELQSTNEELFTVNSEYQSKIIELTGLHNDIDNLLSNTQIGQLILDENLEIRHFSSTVKEIFKLISNDIGRSITHINHFIADCDIVSLISDVNQHGKLIEREVALDNGIIYLVRVVPYQVTPKHFAGTVVSFINITDYNRKLEMLVRENQELRLRLT